MLVETIFSSHTLLLPGYKPFSKTESEPILGSTELPVAALRIPEPAWFPALSSCIALHRQFYSLMAPKHVSVC